MTEQYPGLRSGRSHNVEPLALVYPPYLKLHQECEILVDSMLGKLAHWLRLLGLKTDFSKEFCDSEIVHREEVLVTRDRNLFINRMRVSKDSILILSQNIKNQLVPILLLIDKVPSKVPVFKYCTVCGGYLYEVPREHVWGKVPDRVFNRYERFWVCSKCGKVYWAGSHHKNMMKLFREVLDLLKHVDSVILRFQEHACRLIILHNSGVTSPAEVAEEYV